MPYVINSSLSYRALEATTRESVIDIMKLDPRNKLGFGVIEDEVFHNLREQRRNGLKHYVVQTGWQVPIALVSDDMSGKEDSVKVCLVKPNSKNWEKEALNAVAKLKDPEGYELRRNLESVVEFAEKTGIDPSLWRVPVEFWSEDSVKRQEELVERFADEVILATRGKLNDPKELGSILKGYSNSKGMEAYWDKVAELCAKHIMAQAISRQQLEGKKFGRKADDLIASYVAVGDRLSEGFETNVLDKLGEESQLVLKKLVDVFEAIGRALGKGVDQIIDKLSKACGSLGGTLGLDRQRIEEDIKDGLLAAKQEFENMGEKMKTIMKNPATAGFGVAAYASAIPVVEKLSANGSGDVQIAALGAAAVTFALSPLAFGVRDWALKKKEMPTPLSQVQV